MGRRKQLRPHRSVGISESTSSQRAAEEERGNCNQGAPVDEKEGDNSDTPFLVEVDRSSCALPDHDHFDISEVVLTELSMRDGADANLDLDKGSGFYLSFRLCNINEHVCRIRLGHWPILSSDSIFLEITGGELLPTTDTQHVIVSGRLDGPDEGVSALVHLVSMKFLTLRPAADTTLYAGTSVRIRVEILGRAFAACESLLDNTRPLWKKSMMNVMAWLRPEVLTSQVRYGIVSISADMGPKEGYETQVLRKNDSFDASRFYEAIKPSKAEPMLEDELPNLVPRLRPYQRRAAYWMVQREKGATYAEWERSQFSSPLCIPVDFVDIPTRMFFNPFSGSIALHPEYYSPFVFGGILADEMGLGKTVEVLACIFSHQKSATRGGDLFKDVSPASADQRNLLKRLRRERVECICGAVSESPRYKGLWVQCDLCDAWQHADCVGYSTRRKTCEGSGFRGRGCKRKFKERVKSNAGSIIEMDGDHICRVCLELLDATDTPLSTGATLIVCPAPILSQWNAEIIRHTYPGSLRTVIYEGVKNTCPTNSCATEISELVAADIVLTTYDVLKEDLCHDTDRHEGDRRFLRFQKRYPVIPTLLTRIFWWRICLDEAQMVESNTAAATEMAMRLHAKYRWCITGTPIQRRLDDLYGLLRFIKASPFDDFRWWTDVIRDPYEGRDAVAMEFTHNFFRQIMWRSSKAQISDELELPPQEECLSWLSFSPIEEYFYQRQHETCVTYAHEVIEGFKDDVLRREVPGSVSSVVPSHHILTHAEATKLLNSLLKLRQACCHPQIGSSGLRSLQQSPMTMEEILKVLVGKTKIEGEEALRRLIVALNALAGIAIIEQDVSRAASLYKDALSFAELHSGDFRLDPLLSLHIHCNLADILSDSLDSLHPLSSRGSPRSSLEEGSKTQGVECNPFGTKGSKIGQEVFADSALESKKLSHFSFDTPVDVLNGSNKADANSLLSSSPSTSEDLKMVCDAFNDNKDEQTIWWLEALHYIEQNEDASSELIRKIGEALTGSVNVAGSLRIASRFRSISALKYFIQTGLDSLEACRRQLLDRLLDIDQTMDRPREQDIECVRYCRNCQANGDEGPLCVACELDELFQVYEARLFRLNKARDGGIIASAEEAVDLQKKKSALNRFYWKLSQTNNNSHFSSALNEGNKRKRDVGENVMVSRTPSELEVSLGVLKSYCRAKLGEACISAANKHLFILEGMRKEYAYARSLATAQAQVLRAYDEMKMATSRLRLRESENDNSIDALSPEEIITANIEHSNEMQLAMAALSRIKGQLRYLQGLVLSKEKAQIQDMVNMPLTQDRATTLTMHAQVSVDAETCPVCHENLRNQKMVFQCAHFTCCKCFFAMTEHRFINNGKFQDKWLMCPTCRQHTDFRNIAFADERKSTPIASAALGTFEVCKNSETTLIVQGSYGTKIEAVTRRILWIRSRDPKAKVLVFTSWNDVLDVLEHALTTNGISYVRMKGGRKAHAAISRFKGQKSCVKPISSMDDQHVESKDIQVLLLLIQHGANGLNLLEAQHVVLVEPLLNPSAEAQAISRVHRMGQEQRTLVHRFIVKGTVEESIYKLNRNKSIHSIISGNTKNQDQPLLTLKDVESLFPTAMVPVNKEERTESLMELPPSVAAAVAAERRIREQKGKSL
ncbi:SNF2, N-terminal [Dillenia turbinata]|uniref:SNF2, N-terminal n=1 Tax=Dillenia turbinata TaxID=194707 RepID=A0AAN8VF36_9MAGN